MIYIILTILKVIVCLVGFSLTSINLIKGIPSRNKMKLKRGGVIFALTWVLIVLITVVELYMVS